MCLLLWPFDHESWRRCNGLSCWKKDVWLCGKDTVFVTIRYNIVSNRFYFTYQYKQYEMEFFANDLETALGELMRVD